MSVRQDQELDWLFWCTAGVVMVWLALCGLVLLVEWLWSLGAEVWWRGAACILGCVGLVAIKAGLERLGWRARR